ncbi:MAG: hypothetical protein NTY02_01860, partial [Acidobacteria bacterium]|nr:hypothetical protein [Acidobacteriota bacterium]
MGLVGGGAVRHRRDSTRCLVRRVVCVAVSLALGAHLHGAKSVTKTATASVTVSALAKLTLSTASLAFPDADPDTVPAIPATSGPVTITAKARTTI